MAEKYLDYSGTDLLWRRIVELLNRKLEEVKGKDASIKVVNKNQIAVNISASDKNLLELKRDGLYAHAPDKMHKLTFGSDQDYVYDGSEDVTVPVYPGNYSE